jgi:hypothetical protein
MWHAYGNANIHSHGNCNGNSHIHANGNIYGNRYSNGYRYSNGDCTAAAFTDTTASANPARASGQQLLR